MAIGHEREFRAPVGGGEIVGWRRDGPDGGPNALLLHGGPGLSEYMAELAFELGTVVSTARYQQRGLGPSVTEGAKTIESHATDAVAVLDALGWNEAVIVGHSWGGHLAMHFGVRHPDRTAALVVLDPLGAVGDGGMASLGPNLTAQMSEAERVRLAELDAIEHPTETEQLAWMDICWPYYFGDPRSAPPVPSFRHDPDASETWVSIRSHFETRTLESGLPTYTKPFLLIHGERSPIPLVEAERTVALVPGSELVVHRGKGHFGWLEEPGFIGHQVARFLRDRR